MNQLKFQYIPCCYLSGGEEKNEGRNSQVSIHPMLLFIKKKLECTGASYKFQYIPCCYLSWSIYFKAGICGVSIHPMLLFIAVKATPKALELMFQYIPCCYLSRLGCTLHVSTTQFQYIPCCYLSLSNEIQTMIPYVSIHPMLLFISIVESSFTIGSTFQYIPCCYLSKESLLSIDNEYLFQYIPCCYLSSNSSCVLKSLLMFQYIPCCYLSQFP